MTSDGSAYECVGRAGDDDIVLPVAADSLSDAVDIEVSVAPVETFDDPEPGNQSASLTLQPGADLGLALSVFSANPDRNQLVTLASALTGVRPGSRR